MRSEVQRLKATAPRHRSLFANQRHRPSAPDRAFKTEKERFQDKDLRKKVGSDIDLDHAQALLGHTAAETTRRHFRLRGERVKPAK